MNRREWLMTCGGGLLGGIALTSGCDEADGMPTDPGGLPPVGAAADSTALPPDYLCATFEPRADRAIAWVAAPRATTATIELWRAGASAAVDVGQVLVSDELGLVGSAVLPDLEPDVEYRYRARFDDGGPGPWLRLRTAPDPTVAAPVSFLFSADIGPERDLYDIFSMLIAERGDFYLHLGDWPYADKAPAAVTLTEFRGKHRAVREPDEIQEWLWATPVAPIYDDHDIVNNWTSQLAVEDPALLENGLRSWREYCPLEDVMQYRDFRWGRLAHFFVLDTRLYRSGTSVEPAARTMLGAAQRDWLIEAMTASDAAFKILVSSVPIAFDGTNDDWGPYAAERDQLLADLADAGVAPIVVLSADRHWFAARHLAGGVREYQVGPLAAGLGNYPTSFPDNVVASALARNAGRIDITLDGAVATLTFHCIGEDGGVLYSESFDAPLP